MSKKGINMGDISEHFSRSEYTCDCGNQGKKREDGYCGGDLAAVDIELNNAHEAIRKRLGLVVGEEVSILLSSGNRCQQHNDDIGGTPRSYHARGMGSDLKFKFKKTKEPVDIALCYDAIDYLFPSRYGLKLYSNRVHFDIRSEKWRDK